MTITERLALCRKIRETYLLPILWADDVDRERALAAAELAIFEALNDSYIGGMQDGSAAVLAVIRGPADG